MRGFGAAAVLSCVLLALGSPAARGIEPQKTEAVAYRLQVSAPDEYATVYSPPQADTLYLIAGTDNAFDARWTLVYYWPLTREYFESWDKLDEPVEGSLEVLAGSRVLARLSRQEVVFSYPTASAQGKGTLHAGPEAREVRQTWETRQKEYERGMELYSRALIEYRRTLRAFMRQTGPRSPPQPPVEPEPPKGFVSDLQSAFVVNLPEGSYALRVSDPQGNVVEGSERRLVVFSAIEAPGTGWEIFPEERWTARMPSDTPADSLFCAAGRELYLIPHRTGSYRQDLLERLRNPQSRETSQRIVHVATTPLEQGRLLLSAPGELPREVARVPYYVKQAPGSELGYSILEWSPEVAGSDGPTFGAFRLSFDPADAGRKWRILLEDPATGREYPGSERSIRVVDPGSRRLPWLFALAPLAAGLSVMVWRRRKR